MSESKPIFFIQLLLWRCPLLVLFAVMYLVGMAIYLCILIIAGLGSTLFYQVFGLSHKYGEHGLMKRNARRYVPTYLKFKSRRLFYEKR